jgi:hypothetical protein
MADIKFACPNCGQHITCDELWGGHQLDCPSCKNPLVVPAPAGPPPAAQHAAPRPLVPKAPATPEPRLAINTGHAAAQSAANAPQRTIPIRNLTPPPPKKKNPVVTYSIYAMVLIALGVGVYFGYPWISRMQHGVTTASNEAAKNSDGGEVGHIANLNKVLAATEPGRAPVDGSTAGPRQRRTGVGQQIPMANGGGSDAASTSATEGQPLIPAVWTLDLTKARIPDGRANGSLAGTNFVPETARVDPVGSAQVLRLVQGQAISPDREVLIYLHLKGGEKLGGQAVNVSQDMSGAGVPQVTKRWKTNPKYAPQYKSFTSGYAMRLELGQLADGAMPGKIFLALPDPEQSVVAGTFRATIITNVPVMDTTAQAPVAVPSTPTSADAAMQARYGLRRGQ